MNRKLVPILMLAAAAGPAAAGPQPLTNAELGAVTAGSASAAAGTATHAAGGFVLANDAGATVDESNTLTLETDAQSGAQALNLVNAADALVAQGVNVWDGHFQASNASAAAVEQSNLVVQRETTRAATVAGYRRDANEIENTTLSTTTSNLDTIDLVSDVHVDTNHQVLGQSVNVGLGVGVAGRVGIELDAASIDFGLEATSEFRTNVGVNGEINLPKPFGPMQASGTLDSEIITGGSVTLNVDTPPITIDAIGSVCYTKLGICSATADDDSTYQTNTTHDETLSREIQGAVALDGAQAEYVVIDESTLALSSGQSLTVAAGAQSNLAAVNAVNAVGSMIANGVNVSRTGAEAGSAMPATLSQRNVVIQGF